ncbi:LtfC-like domain-containing protein [Rhodococcus sp. SJ-2]
MMLGWKPIYENICLNGGDWIFERTNPKGPFVPGMTAEVVWGNTVTWEGTVDGSTLSWRIESEACTPAIIPDGTPFVIWVHYPNNTTSTTDDYPWIRGRAYRTDMED